jgi:hypothetical protein
MIKRAISSLLMLGAVTGMLMLELDARGRGGGPGAGRGGGGTRGGIGRGTRGRTGGVGRIGRNSFGMGRFKGGNTSAKEWQAIQDQEDRIKLIKERRDALMDADRAKQQELVLEGERGNAAIAATIDASIR